MNPRFSLYLAPMAGISHCAFRRLCADFGGYDALYTEMLPAVELYNGARAASPALKRTPGDGHVVYQLLLNGREDFPRIANALMAFNPAAVDINLGCPAPIVSNNGGGSGLYADFDRLSSTLHSLRKAWPGSLYAKIRLGSEESGWRERLTERLRLFEDTGIDRITVHPRFTGEKLKRRARWELFPWIASQTRLPIIANGDITSLADLETGKELFSGMEGIMIGRMAVIRPWIFSEFRGIPVEIDYCEVWRRFFKYVNEAFEPSRAIGKIKEFTSWYARNFFFGHTFYSAVQSAPTLEAAEDRAMVFLSSNPQLDKKPSILAGI